MGYLGTLRAEFTARGLSCRLPQLSCALSWVVAEAISAIRTTRRRWCVFRSSLRSQAYGGMKALHWDALHLCLVVRIAKVVLKPNLVNTTAVASRTPPYLG